MRLDFETPPGPSEIQRLDRRLGRLLSFPPSRTSWERMQRLGRDGYFTQSVLLGALAVSTFGLWLPRNGIPDAGTELRVALTGALAGLAFARTRWCEGQRKYEARGSRN